MEIKIYLIVTIINRIKTNQEQYLPLKIFYLSGTSNQRSQCELCDIILEKDKGGRIMVNMFFYYKEVIDVFHENNYITTIEKLSFNLINVNILGSM